MSIFDSFFELLNGTLKAIIQAPSWNLNTSARPDAHTPIAPASTGYVDATPTISEFFNAARREYLLPGSGDPAGMKPFMQNGKQMTVNNFFSGAVGHAWVTDKNQIIIAYSGTSGGLNTLNHPLIGGVQFLSDVQVWSGLNTQAERDSLSFANQVVAQAAKQGINAQNVFVTGHSLGAIEAEYVAQQSGLGGVAFDGTGIPPSATAKGDGKNFVNILAYGDPVSNYGTDIGAMNGFVANNVSHYGQSVMVGDPAEQTALINATKLFNSDGSFTWNSPRMQALLEYGLGAIRDHLPATLANGLGITASPSNFILDNLVFTSNKPSSVSYANDSIPQFLAHQSAVHGAVA